MYQIRSTAVPSFWVEVPCRELDTTGGVPRGTSLIRNTPFLGPYIRTLPRVIEWFCGGRAVSYERGTPVSRSPGDAKRMFQGFFKCSHSSPDSTQEELEPAWIRRPPTRYKQRGGGCRCRPKTVHVRQTRPDSGLGFQFKGLEPFQKLFPLCSEADSEYRGTSPIRKRPPP